MIPRDSSGSSGSFEVSFLDASSLIVALDSKSYIKDVGSILIQSNI